MRMTLGTLRMLSRGIGLQEHLLLPALQRWTGVLVELCSLPFSRDQPVARAEWCA